MTRISIITPVFNGARFVNEAANSVLAQTCRDWEWIIINDGSTDGTAARLDGLTDPRIRVIHQANAGAADRKNNVSFSNLPQACPAVQQRSTTRPSDP